MGVIAAATGDTASKYVARRETPLYIPENCTQCMECISVCPDTALPNMLAGSRAPCSRTAVTHYVTDPASARKMLRASCRRSRSRPAQRMIAEMKTGTPLPKIIREVTGAGRRLLGRSQGAVLRASSTRCRWPIRRSTPSSPRRSARRPAPAASSPSSSPISARAARPASRPAAITMALKMVQETEEVNAEHETGTAFLDLLPDTSQKYLGLYNAANPADSKTATLRNMLMVRRNYDALVSGDGACAGCGEKSVLRSIAAVTEAYMRPVYHAKSDRFVAKAGELEKNGVAQARGAQGQRNPDEYAAAPPGHRAPDHGPGRRRRRGHQGPHRGATKQATAPSPTRSSSKPRRGPAHRSLQSQEPAAHRRTPGQRHVRDGHGRAHRLQHGLRLHRCRTTRIPIRG